MGTRGGLHGQHTSRAHAPSSPAPTICIPGTAGSATGSAVLPHPCVPTPSHAAPLSVRPYEAVMSTGSHDETG